MMEDEIDRYIKELPKNILKLQLLLEHFFKGDAEKCKKWTFIENPLLGNVRPIEMIMMGRIEKLISFIEHKLKENVQPEKRKVSINDCSYQIDDR